MQLGFPLPPLRREMMEYTGKYQERLTLICLTWNLALKQSLSQREFN